MNYDLLQVTSVSSFGKQTRKLWDEQLCYKTDAVVFQFASEHLLSMPSFHLQGI